MKSDRERIVSALKLWSREYDVFEIRVLDAVTPEWMRPHYGVGILRLHAHSRRRRGDLPSAFLPRRVCDWQALIDEGKFSNLIELARAVGKDYAYVGRILRLTLLAPDIIHAALTGTLPEGVGVEHLRRTLPALWSEQKKELGME